MSKHGTVGGGLVYSTESGRMCPACRKPVAQCACNSAAGPRATDGVVRVSRETKGRGGKGVTVIKGVPVDGDAMNALGKQLRASCGTGGTVKDGTIELQGDHCERAIELLKQRGWQVKRSGG